MRKEGLRHIVDKNTKIMILGSFPGEKSLSKGFYYSNSHNKFWKIIEKITDSSLISIPLKERGEELLKHRIGLWDVIHSCEREGSSDSKIINPEFNDFEKLRKEYPRIHRFIFNGRCAEEYAMQIGLGGIYVPSSSPAYTKHFGYKLDKWKKAISRYI